MLRRFLSLFEESTSAKATRGIEARKLNHEDEKQPEIEAIYDQDYELELSNDEIEIVAAATIDCVPQIVRQAWAENAAACSDENLDFSESSLSKEELEEDIFRLSLSTMMFLGLDDMPEELWDLAASAEEGLSVAIATRAETIENLLALRESDEAFDAVAITFIEAVELSENDIVFPLKNRDLLYELVEEKAIALRAIDQQVLQKEINKHQEILVPAVSRQIAINTNKYGRIDYGPALSEVAEFIRSAQFERDFRTFTFDGVVARTLEFLIQNFQLNSETDEYPFDGHEFEAWCSRRLAAVGISNHVTSNGADQGVDIIANVNGREVAIQCKRYNKPVGNKAVQEVIAGARFYGIEFTCVVSSSGFTKSAEELAEKGSVTLISVEDLGKLKSYF